MELSIFLAKAWGFYLIIVSVALLVNKNNLKTLFHYSNDEDLPFLSGFIILIIGILSVLSHNVWTDDWRTIITLIGWVALLKGIIRLFAPDVVSESMKRLKKSGWVTPMILVCFILGLYLTVVGFVYH